MGTALSGLEHDVNPQLQSQQQLLAIARRLDRLGRSTEQFLCQQLEQLERAIDEFECERAAWQRHFKRESTQLAVQQEEFEQLLQAHASSASESHGSTVVSMQQRQEIADRASSRSGDAPLRLLLQPGDATQMQIELLLFEMSKLNREMGGLGLRFEIDNVSVPRKRILGRKENPPSCGEIIELTAFSRLPLTARGRHVALDVDVTDRLIHWIAFKSRLIRSTLVDTKLALLYKKSRSMGSRGRTRGVVHEAIRRVGDAKDLRKSEYPSAGLLTRSYDALHQQAARLESCYQQLQIDSGLRAHVELHVAP